MHFLPPAAKPYTTYIFSELITAIQAIQLCRGNSMQFLLQPQNHTSKPGAIFSAICRRDIAGVSNIF